MAGSAALVSVLVSDFVSELLALSDDSDFAYVLVSVLVSDFAGAESFLA